jgi:palmitoyl-protein thioesterase
LPSFNNKAYTQQANIADYLLNSGFLKDLNNERYGDLQVGGSEDYLGKDGHPDPAPRNQTLKDNFVQLQNFVMFSFS